ncbi:MAG TPA: PA0069 family radical SAM protein [Kiloniellales bacterium]
MVDVLPDRARKGRGAVSNRSGRYEPHQRVAVDDGWAAAAADAVETRAGDDAPPSPPLATSVGIDASRTAIARNTSPDIPFDRSINPYRGCEHGCVYCFARPTHAWLGLSPGLDFETKLFAKPEAPRLLEVELAKPSYRPATIALGTNTDPYQPIERRLQITRGILEVLLRARHPVVIVTKSHLVLRDLDVLSALAAARLVRVMVSVTTLDPLLARRMEPRAPTPARRVETLRALAGAGVPAGVMAAPMIPGLNDGELEGILEASAQAGAEMAGYVLLRLPLEIKHLFLEWLEAHYPARKARVVGLLREARGGKLYDSAWGTRMKGRGVHAELLARRFDLACKRLGLDRGTERWDLDSGAFRRPRWAGEQLSLL